MTEIVLIALIALVCASVFTHINVTYYEKNKNKRSQNCKGEFAGNHGNLHEGNQSVRIAHRTTEIKERVRLR